MTCLHRLLRDLHTVEANLEFWQNRLHQGSHLRFMLFGQGPVSFAHDVLCTLERKRRQRMTSATDKIERRVSSIVYLTLTPCLIAKQGNAVPASVPHLCHSNAMARCPGLQMHHHVRQNCTNSIAGPLATISLVCHTHLDTDLFILITSPLHTEVPFAICQSTPAWGELLTM